jgi:hypothetical protein
LSKRGILLTLCLEGTEEGIVIRVIYLRTPLIGKTLFGFVWRGWEGEGKGKE